jgi:hypothetical protein
MDARVGNRLNQVFQAVLQIMDVLLAFAEAQIVHDLALHANVGIDALNN